MDALDRCLNAGLAHGDLEAEDPSTLTLTNVLRVARLCQLAIQYFIATQDSLVVELSSAQVQCNLMLEPHLQSSVVPTLTFGHANGGG